MHSWGCRWWSEKAVFTTWKVQQVLLFSGQTPRSSPVVAKAADSSRSMQPSRADPVPSRMCMNIKPELFVKPAKYILLKQTPFIALQWRDSAGGDYVLISV